MQNPKQRVNQLGGFFSNGRPQPLEVREKIVKMYASGIRKCEISRHLRVSHSCVSKILEKYHETGSIKPRQYSKKRNSEIPLELTEKIIEYRKQAYLAWEIRDLLIKNEKITVNRAPTVDSIRKLIRKNGMAESSDPSQTSEDEIFENRKIAEIPKRRKTTFEESQLIELEKVFEESHYPNAITRETVANQIGVSESRVQVWFSNRRARWRNEMTATKFHPAVVKAEISENPIPFIPQQPPVSTTEFDPAVYPDSYTFMNLKIVPESWMAQTNIHYTETASNMGLLFSEISTL